MQTFLPYPDYAMSAAVLDYQRLGNQRKEVIQILDAVHEIDTRAGKPFPMAIRNHPVTKMWEKNILQLCEYGLVMVEEWVARCYTDNVCGDKLRQHMDWAEGGNMLKPTWFGKVDFHLSHQSVLLKKDPVWYRQYFPDTPDDLVVFYPKPQ